MHDLANRVRKLTHEQRTELVRLLRKSDKLAADQPHQALFAYVVPKEGFTLDPDELRAYLKERLPSYMLPSGIIPLDALPRTPNGKLNHDALPTPFAEGAFDETFIAPRNAIEEQLGEIWATVLGVDRVSVHDNFFEIGGDSILSIQIVARSRSRGLKLKPGDLFDHQTIAELARITEVNATSAIDEGSVYGEVELTPIQHWFFEQPLPEPHNWLQTLWLETGDSFDADRFDEAFAEVLRHHDALRLRFVQEEDRWRQFLDPVDSKVALTQIDLSDLPDREMSARMAELAAEMAGSVDLEAGRPFRIALFRSGSGNGDRLFIAIHHLVIDLVSWSILIEDLETAYRSRLNDEVVRLPPKSSSFKSWSEGLTALARSPVIENEAEYWSEVCSSQAHPVPIDRPGVFTEKSAITLTSMLSVDETRSLLHEASSAYNTTTEDVILAALVESFGEWTGTATLLVGLERHGRAGIDPTVDVTRTVGWFTSYFPVMLDLRGRSSPSAAIKSTKEQLRRIPRQGIGYGILRYLRRDSELSRRLREAPQPEVIFSYAGRTGSPAPAKTPFRSVGPIGMSRSPSNMREHRLEIAAYVDDERLRVDWTYSSNLHDAGTIERVADRFIENLRSLLVHCLSTESGGYTPSDFPDAGLTQEELDRLVGRLFS